MIQTPYRLLIALTAGLLLPLRVSAQPSSDVEQRLGISPQIASVADNNLSSRLAPDYILIQDVHQHPEAQAHIAELLIQGYRHWGLRSVYIEGAFSSVDLSVFRDVPAAARADLIQRLANDGRLTGAEMAAILLNPMALQLIGIENPVIYKKNVETYLALERLRGPALAELASIRLLQKKMRIPDSHVLARQLRRTELLVRLRLTPAEYDEYLRDRSATPCSPAIDPVVGMAENFYRLVDQRSRVFLSQIEYKGLRAKGPRVVVVGGFHTAEMTRELRESGKTYIVLAPKITLPQDGALYEERMLESVSALQILPRSSSSLFQ